MKPRPISNPPNPWASSEVEYLDEVPRARLELYEDHTKEILARNDSPDVGFEFSVNPYRGCMHACAYCLSGETVVLMGDGRPKPLARIRPGDEVYGTILRGLHRYLVKTPVLAHWETVKPAYRLHLEDGTQLVASGDHRFLTNRGWKFVAEHKHDRRHRAVLMTGHELVGVGRLAPAPADTTDYRRGYLCGMFRGDGLRRSRRGGNAAAGVTLVDIEAAQRVRKYLADLAIDVRDVVQQQASGAERRRYETQPRSYLGAEGALQFAVQHVSESDDWRKGFLAGMFDAEGSYANGTLRIACRDQDLLFQVRTCLRALRFDIAISPPSIGDEIVRHVSVLGDVREHLRFFHLVDSASSRKRDVTDQILTSLEHLRVVEIEPLGVSLPMFDITTGTGDFIANGVVSHNCYARPGHEYLSFRAGTDFETKIVYKPKAPELLQTAFERPSWKGSTLVFSGVTDCYQPIEASLRLTRGCLQVCAEYRQPVGIITKAALIERDIDVLQQLASNADVKVHISVPFWNPRHARAIEPYVATPRRRLQTVAALAKAGIPVGVMVAPIIPGLSDEDIPFILQAAKDAGAQTAGYVLLRLPGPVKSVFEERLRATLPLRAERVLHRVRETRGGKLYDSRFGIRGRGEGKYAQAVAALFESTATRLGLAAKSCSSDRPTTFRRPERVKPQLSLF